MGRGGGGARVGDGGVVAGVGVVRGGGMKGVGGVDCGVGSSVSGFLNLACHTKVTLYRTEYLISNFLNENLYCTGSTI